MRFYFLLLLTSLLCDKLQAQKQFHYTFDRIGIDSALSIIEQDHKIQVLFLDEWVQDQYVEGNFHSKYLTGLINQVLKPHGLSSMRYDDHTYILLLEIQSGQMIEQYTSSGEVVKSLVIGEAKANITKATISGRIVDAENSEPLIGATVFIQELNKGTVTGLYGNFELELPVGKHEIEISNVGYHKDVLHVILQSDDRVEFPLLSSTNSLQEVIIKGRKEDAGTSEGQISRDIVKMEDVEYLPSFMGEKDVIKTIEMLPGVNATGEGANGYSVRGGNAGQNLIFLEGAPLYNPSHLFGLFSVFNPGIVESAVIYKGAMPAQYGGRVSSAMDVNLKSGEGESWHGEAAIGLMSSRAHIEGPITEKFSLAAGGKLSYVNRYLDRLENWNIRQSKGGFYDANLKFSYELSEKNFLTLNGFLSGDDFTLPTGEQITYGNRLSSARWTHVFSEDLISDLSFAYSGYSSTINSQDSLSERYVENNISSFTIKGLTTLYRIDDHTIMAGFESGITAVDPGRISTSSPTDTSIVQIEKERGLESALFISDEYQVNDAISIGVGLRYSNFLLLGAGTDYLYEEGQQRRLSSVTDSVKYSSGAIIQSYGGLEPRLFLNYKLDNRTSLKFNFGRSRQYLHLVFNAASVSPLSIWKLSDRHLKPQIADLAAIGATRSFFKSTVEVSGEAFYRYISNLPDYKNGAELLTNPHLERELISGNGKAYGFEFQLSKKNGPISGWLSYTYARSFNRMNSSISEEQINNGELYRSDNDRPHSLTISGDYIISQLWSLSFNWVYNSGRPISLPDAIYYQNGMEVAYFSKRNEYRIPDYHRLDLSLNLKGTSLKINKKWDVTWAFSVYNLYGRDNAYSVFFEREDSRIVAKKLSILASPIPSVTLIAKF